MFFPTSPNTLPQHETLRAVVLMRTVALLCQAAGLAITQFWLGIDLPLVPLLSVMALLAALNAWTWRRMRHLQPAGNRELFAQLLADIAALSVLLYFSGGATNPFASFYLPALAVAAALLPWHYALLLACLSIGGYSFMTDHYVPLHLNDPERAISYHLAGMWANFAASAALITWFVARLSRALRQRDAQLASAREAYLEQERLSALGMQAANAAHEMGTPLSTVAIIAGELLHEASDSTSANHHALAPFREDFATIEAQIALCHTALQRMGTHSGDALSTTPVAAWLEQYIDEWRLRHPAARIELSLAAGDARIAEALSAAQILTTLLDNAVQAAGGDAAIRVSASRELDRTRIEVVDNGAGIAPDLLPHLGSQQVASSSNGQGIGLLLAFATARRIGASIALAPHMGGGTSATLIIPAA